MAKKIVLVFVEGASDDSIFDVILDESCDLTGYKVEIMGGTHFQITIILVKDPKL